jgi:hypothetical protein
MIKCIENIKEKDFFLRISVKYKVLMKMFPKNDNLKKLFILLKEKLLYFDQNFENHDDDDDDDESFDNDIFSENLSIDDNSSQNTDDFSDISSDNEFSKNDDILIHDLNDMILNFKI